MRFGSLRKLETEMSRTRSSRDLAKQAEAFDLDLFKMPQSSIAEKLRVSVKTVQRWVKAERARRQTLATGSIREEVLLQVDRVVTAAWTDYNAQEVGTHARGKALNAVITALKFRAELHGLAPRQAQTASDQTSINLEQEKGRAIAEFVESIPAPLQTGLKAWMKENEEKLAA